MPKEILHYPTDSLKAIIPFLAKGSKMRREAIKEIIVREKVKSSEKK